MSDHRDDIYPPEMQERPDFNLTDFEGQSATGKAWMYVVGALVLVLIVYSSVLSTVTIVQVRQTQTQNKPLTVNTNRLVAQQQDCLHVDGKCFERNQRRLAQALGKVKVSTVQVTSATVACTVARLQTNQSTAYGPIFTCVQQTLRLQSKHSQ